MPFVKHPPGRKRNGLDLNIGMDLRDVGYEDIKLVGGLYGKGRKKVKLCL
jgi:hypothetical protein